MIEKQNVEWKREWKDEFLPWICGMANGKGGTLYIGLDDNGEVVGVDNAEKLLDMLPNKIRNSIGIVAEVNYQQEGDKAYIEIIVSAHPFPVSCQGRYYLRSGSTLQHLSGATLDEFMLRKQGVTWDSVPVTYLGYDDLSDKAIDLFLDKAVKKGRLDSNIQDESKENLIAKLNLIKNGYLTNGAALLFTDDPEKYVFGSFIKIGFFESDADIIYQEEIHGSLLQQVDETIKLLYRMFLKAKIFYEGIQRVERYPFPEEAVREALLNAIVHKDYASYIPIQISVYDDKLYIANDGRLPDTWTADNLLGKHKSVPYNPLIAHVFYLAGFIETWGRGIEKIYAACARDGIYEPQYTVHARDIMVCFTAPEERIIRTGNRIQRNDNNIIGEADRNDDKYGRKYRYEPIRKAVKKPKRAAERRMSRERKIFLISMLIGQRGEIANKDARELLGLADSTTKRFLNELCDDGILEAVGEKKNRVYRMKRT